jgi:hypothetical protein
MTSAESKEARSVGRKNLLSGIGLLVLTAVAASIAWKSMGAGTVSDARIGALLAAAALAGMLGALKTLQGVMEVATGMQLRVSGSPQNGAEQALRVVYILVFFAGFFALLWYFFLREGAL